MAGTGGNAAVAGDGAGRPAGPAAYFAVNRAGVGVAVLPLVEVVAELALVHRLLDDSAGAGLGASAARLGATIPDGPSGKLAVNRLRVAGVGVLKLDGTALGDGKVGGILAGVLETEGDDFLAASGGASEVFLVGESSVARVSLATNFAGVALGVCDELAFAFAVNEVATGVLAFEFAVAIVLVEFEGAFGSFRVAGFLGGVTLVKSNGRGPISGIVFAAVEGHDKVELGRVGKREDRRGLVVDGDLT